MNSSVRRFKNVIVLAYMDDLHALDLIRRVSIIISNTNSPRVRRPLRDRLNPLTAYDDNEFYERYRMRKHGFTEILGMINLETTQRIKGTNRPILPIQLLSLGIRFYATGAFQISTGDCVHLHQSTMCKYLPVITEALAALSPQIISFPESSTKTKDHFLEYCGLPSVIGLIDGTHIAINCPGGMNSELFRNRKGFFSYNTQVICDERLKILDIVSGWPGSTHDSRVWDNSYICTRFEDGQQEGILLGDSGYPLAPYLMIPYPHPPNSREKGRFNRALCKGRSGVERCIGVLKRRWPCLSRKLCCNHEKVPDIIVACAVLHNLCIDLNDYWEENTTFDDSDDENVEFRPGSTFALAGEEVREMLSQRFCP